MTTLIFEDESFAAHETPDGHPERAGRYAAAQARLMQGDLAAIERRRPPLASREMLARAHPGNFIAEVEAAAPSAGMTPLDPDTWLGPSSLTATLKASGGACAAVDAVMAGAADNAFLLARPPGHHAEAERAMGFCIFNSAAVAAFHARANHGAERIAVVDFDVHHGNGTEAIFWDDQNAFFASSHEFPQYPGTGRQTDRGGFGNIANAPLPTGANGDQFRRVWGEQLLPALDAFDPDIILISAGFDAHCADPLGGLELVEDDFVWVTDEIMSVAASKCDGRVVSLLEGGYDLNALAESVAAHVGTLAGIHPQ